ncbi:MAG: ATP-binding protein, partial [Dehalococcoidia bacterium]|nr:ATP-binding protein [Dehalococcoidia bacterium]
LGRGDLGQRVSSTSEDEIGRLGESFNRMASDLEKAERQRRALLADVAHELRTPLSNIGGYVEAMCDGLVEANAENLGIVRQQVAQLTRLVEDLRLLTQAESGALKLHVQLGSANDLLEQVAESFRPRAFAKGITLRCEIAETIPPVHMDHVRIRQVLYNLVENAVTHTPEGGMITLAAAMCSENRIRVSVTDTGPGVGPEDLETIFERLHRLDPSRSRVTGGAGLGLTIARRIMETHGGRIWAESKPGRGSSFLFELPLSPSIVPGSSAQHERHEPQG